jgi:signal transduction histidine kinase
LIGDCRAAAHDPLAVFLAFAACVRAGGPAAVIADSGDDADAASRSFDEHVLSLLARHGMGIRLPVLLAMALMAAMAARQAPRAAAAWLLLVGAMLALRWWALRRLAAATHIPARRRLHSASALSLTNGCVHALSLLFAPGFTDYERAVQSVVLLALCTGALATTSGYLPVFGAYLLPVLLGLAGSWALLENGGGDLTVRLAMAALVLVFGAALAALGRDGFRLYRDLYFARARQDEANVRLARALSEAEAADRAKTRFLAAASHDLRQPLHTLTLFGSALLHQPLEGDARRIAGHMESALRALGAQMDALLDLSRLDAQALPVRAVDMSLYALAQRLAEEFRLLVEQKGLQWTVNVPPAAQVHCDPLLLERLLRNLIDNAVKYTDAGGVRFEVREDDIGWRVEVADTGRGIARHEQQRVFEEFYQLDNPEHDRAKGLGLGLSIVNRLAQLLHLHVSLQSESGVGTTIGFSLPKLAATAPVDDIVAPEPELSLEGLTVLVIDDEEDVRRGMTTLISALGGRALAATGTADALLAVQDAPPDVVVSDFLLAGGDDGLATIARLRAQFPRVRTLLVSGDTSPDRLRQAADAHVRLLHKPVDTGLLLKELARAEI